MPTPFPPSEHSDRLQRIRIEMARLELDLLVTADAANVRYCTGFRGEPRLLLLTAHDLVLFTSFRSQPWAEAQTQGLGSSVELSTVAEPWQEILARVGKNKSLKIGVDRSTTQLRYQELLKTLAPHDLRPETPIESAREIKSELEIQRMRHSQVINEEVFEAVLSQIVPGKTEREIQGHILGEIARRVEVDAYAFAPIVAAAGNAWEIHHLPDSTPLKAGDLVLIDLGVIVEGYASDMTRTLCLGEPSSKMRSIHQAVVEAQSAAIAAMRSGASTHEIDQTARQLLVKTDHGESFTHGLGHSIGMETHDPGPNLSPTTPDVILEPGMTFTVEPGLYLPEAFGVRSEDVVVVREDGVENLTRQSREIIVCDS